MAAWFSKRDGSRWEADKFFYKIMLLEKNGCSHYGIPWFSRDLGSMERIESKMTDAEKKAYVKRLCGGKRSDEAIQKAALANSFQRFVAAMHVLGLLKNE